MQRQLPEGVIICCDFCGTDWDELLPMIEGHHGSVLCLECLKRALAEAQPQKAEFSCTMCLRPQPIGTEGYVPTTRPATANPVASVCRACMRQAAGAFDRDPDVDWKWERK